MARKLGDWLEGFLEYTYEVESPESYKTWVGIVAIASALQRKTFLRFGLETIYPNIYVVLVGPAGRCRKGSAMRAASYLIRKSGIRTSSEAVTRQALIQNIMKAKATAVDPIDPKRIVQHSSLLVFSEEWTVFLGYNNLELMANLTDWYDCKDPWTYSTISRTDEEIRGICLSMVGATTPELITSSMPRDAIGGGLTSRIIFVYEERKGKTTPLSVMTPELLRLEEYLIHDLQEILMMIGEFRLDEAFYDKYVKWYLEQEENPPKVGQHLAAYLSRRQTHMRKLCMALSASRGSSLIVTGEDFDRGLSLLESVEKKMPYAFTGIGESPLAKVVPRVMSFILHKGPEGTTMQELMESFYMDADLETMRKVLQTLDKMKFCAITYENEICHVRHIKK